MKRKEKLILEHLFQQVEVHRMLAGKAAPSPRRHDVCGGIQSLAAGKRFGQHSIIRIDIEIIRTRISSLLD